VPDNHEAPAAAANMPSHLLLLGKLSDFLAFVFRGRDVIREQTAAHSFEKVPRAPRASSHTDVEGASFPAFEARNDFFRRSEETESARQIIGRTQRENAQWNAGVDESRGYFDNCAIAAGGKNEIGGVF
jgi:hypothetical protein